MAALLSVWPLGICTDTACGRTYACEDCRYEKMAGTLGSQIQDKALAVAAHPANISVLSHLHR